MKLVTYDKEENEIVLEVSFWSFLKCNLLTSIALSGLFYVVMAILGAIFVAVGL